MQSAFPIPIHAHGDSKPTVYNYASQIDVKTLEQARSLSKLPFIFPHVALMPDAHFGKGSSVGTVIPTRRAVIPAAVGVDIGCGMIAVQTELTQEDLDERMAQTGRGLDTLRIAVQAVIPMSAGGYNDDDMLDHYWFTEDRIISLEVLAADKKVDLSASPNWRNQMGTLGGGNHFIELCLDNTNKVWLFLHSGSRGVGNKIAQRHIKIAQNLAKLHHITLADPEHAWLSQGTPEFTQYIKELNWAQTFALFNRDEMMDRFATVFCEWMGIEPGDTFGDIEVDRINTHHNYTRMENIFGEDVWVTRKGAISARKDEPGLIPGSMGTASYVVRGKGSALGLNSAPHGAGRAMSRNEAKKKFDENDLAREMVGIEYRHGKDWIDEIPSAYKDIGRVMDDASELVYVTHQLRQILNVKGT